MTVAAYIGGEHDWCSATFTGTRLAMRIDAAPDPAWANILAEWLAALPDRDLPMPRHLVADLLVRSVTTTDGIMIAHLEALLLDRPPVDE